MVYLLFGCIFVAVGTFIVQFDGVWQGKAIVIAVANLGFATLHITIVDRLGARS